MPFELEEADLAEFHEAFRPNALWDRIRQDRELMRWWHVLRELSGEVWIQHGTGAVAQLCISGDRISKVDLLQGEAAEALLRVHGFQVSDEQKRRARRALRRGRLAEEAMNEAWPRGLGLAALPREPLGDGGEQRRYRLSWGGVLEVDVKPDGRVLNHRWHTGGAALDLLTASARQQRRPRR